MATFSATLGSFGAIPFLSSSPSHQPLDSCYSITNPFISLKCPHKFPLCHWYRHYNHRTSKISVSSNGNTQIDEFDTTLRQDRKSSDWKAAIAYRDNRLIYNGRVEGFNKGGMLIRFNSIKGFLPFPHLSPVYSCHEPNKPIIDIANEKVGSFLSVKVIEVDEERNILVFSEKEATWSKHSKYVNIGDIFEARIGYVAEYGAYAYLRFPDGLYHLTGLIHISEVSWDLIQDVGDFLREGDEVRVKVVSIDSVKMRFKLSIKQVEEDPLLETLDKVIPQDGLAVSDSFSGSNGSHIDPLPGLDRILPELLQEDGKTNFKNIHSHIIYPTNGPQLWSLDEESIMKPPIMRRAIGHPKKMRNKSNDEPKNSHVLPRKLATVTCQKCGTMGHNKRSCKGERAAEKAIPKGENINKAKKGGQGKKKKTAQVEIENSSQAPPPTQPSQQ